MQGRKTQEGERERKRFTAAEKVREQKLNFSCTRDREGKMKKISASGRILSLILIGILFGCEFEGDQGKNMRLRNPAMNAKWLRPLRVYAPLISPESAGYHTVNIFRG